MCISVVELTVSLLSYPQCDNMAITWSNVTYWTNIYMMLNPAAVDNASSLLEPYINVAI